MERIRIPIFSGNKINFQKGNAAFTSCVDETTFSPQFKMLRLEACLAGEAASTMKGLGYSLEAYEAAKARLFRKYGGSRRQVQSHLEELRKLKPIRDNSAKELEMFADVIERAVITLKENGSESDLKGGTLHTMVLEKIPERLLAQFYRWLNESKRQESLENLKDWVSEEAAYQIQATEIKNGISPDNQVKRQKNARSTRSFFGHGVGRKSQKCHTCSGNHPVWKCEVFQRLSNDDKWRTAKQLALCFRCLEDNHRGKSCPRSKQCNINGCRGTHHNLLHYDRMPPVPVHSHPRPEAEPYVNRPITPLQTVSVASKRPGISMGRGNSTQRLVTMETCGEQERQ